MRSERVKARIDGTQTVVDVKDTSFDASGSEQVDHGFWVPAWDHCGLNSDWNERAWRLSEGRANLDPGYYLFEDTDSWLLVHRKWLEAEDCWEDDVVREGPLSSCYQTWKEELGGP